MGATLEEAGHGVRLLDLCFSEDCRGDIARALGETKPDLVGVGIRNIDNAAGCRTDFLLASTRDEVIQPLRELFSGPIVIGGPAVGISAAEILAYLDLPYAIQGDGEHAMLELVSRLEAGRVLGDLQGLVHREDGRIVVDNPPMAVPDLNALPTPDLNRYFDLTRYRRVDSPLQVQTKRGCTMRCTYCVYNKIEGRRYRLRSPERVVKDLAHLSRTTGIRHVEFTDSTFNVPLDHAKAILRKVVGAKLGLQLRAMGLNPGFVDEELVILMRKAGFVDVDLGVESCSDTILARLDKGFRVRDVLRAARLLHEQSLPVTWYLLLGAPGETAETLRETFDTVNRAASPWDLVNVGVGIRLYKGAPLTDQVRDGKTACSEDSFLSPVHFEPEALALDEVKAMTIREAARHPNYFMWDEDEIPPEHVMKAIATLSRVFRVRQPPYRLHIAMRMARAGLQRWRGRG